MSKKGFVLMETVVVLLVAVIAMLGLFTTYTYVFNDLKQNNYYDNINDLYKLNVFYKIFKENTVITSKSYIIINSNNCSTYFKNTSNCSSVFSAVFEDSGYENIKLIYVTNVTEFFSATKTADTTKYDLEYIKLLDKAYSHLVLTYEYNNHQYFASLKVADIRG